MSANSEIAQYDILPFDEYSTECAERRKAMTLIKGHRRAEIDDPIRHAPICREIYSSNRKTIRVTTENRQNSPKRAE